jgi:phosphoheptose isomerase
MTFPAQKYDTVGAYFSAYTDRYRQAAAAVDLDRIEAAAALLQAAYRDRRWAFCCGNGGSAAISNHLVCDHIKGVQTDTAMRPRVVSLSSNPEILTAIANDIAYDDVFLYQLRSMAEAGDVLISISSSGDSENIVRAVAWARENGLATIAMTGFSGGRSAELADVNIHVESDNYGVTEDLHQSVMHVLAQYLRQAEMAPDLVEARDF